MKKTLTLLSIIIVTMLLSCACSGRTMSAITGNTAFYEEADKKNAAFVKDDWDALSTITFTTQILVPTAGSERADYEDRVIEFDIVEITNFVDVDGDNSGQITHYTLRDSHGYVSYLDIDGARLSWHSAVPLNELFTELDNRELDLRSSLEKGDFSFHITEKTPLYSSTQPSAEQYDSTQSGIEQYKSP